MAVYLSKMAATMVGAKARKTAAILFILSTAAAILTQTDLMKSPFCAYILL